jgi:hypothetical protein
MAITKAGKRIDAERSTGVSAASDTLSRSGRTSTATSILNCIHGGNVENGLNLVCKAKYKAMEDWLVLSELSDG